MRQFAHPGQAVGSSGARAGSTRLLQVIAALQHPHPARQPATRSPSSLHAQEVREVLRRLAGPARPPQNEGLQHQKSGRNLPIQDARPGAIKKSPRLGTVGQICQAWTEAHRNHSSIRVPAGALARLAGSCKPYELTPLHFQSIVTRWRQNYARNTLANYTRNLRQLAAYIGALARIPLSPFVPKVPHEQARTIIATPDELARLLAAAPGWQRCLLLFESQLGLRLSDALRLAPANWNDQTHTMTLRQKKTGRLLKLPTPKILEEILSAAPPGDPLTPFVQLLRGKPVDTNTAERAWRKLKKITQVNRDLWMHDLRRTSGVTLYEQTHDLRIVEQFLGHASLNSTAHYLEHRDPETLRPLIEALRPQTRRVQ